VLPDDGNRYEVVDGDLFVTPPPSQEHEEVLAVLSAVLTPYVTRQRLGRVYHPRAVVEAAGSRAEPDLMVRAVQATRSATWASQPVPILVIENLSDATRRRDQVEKRAYYARIGVPSYWIVDRESRTIRVVRPGRPDDVCDSTLVWHAAGASEPLALDVRALFHEALGTPGG
jgi:Uma2 family endonuclease